MGDVSKADVRIVENRAGRVGHQKFAAVEGHHPQRGEETPRELGRGPVGPWEVGIDIAKLLRCLLKHYC